MTSRRKDSARFILALALVIGLIGAAGAEAEQAFYWLPSAAQIEEAPADLDLHYSGLSGRLLRHETGAHAGLEAQGGRNF